MQEHTQICKELDGTLCAVDSLSGRLQRLAELCEASSGAERAPSCRALLLRLAEQCASVASADAPSTPSRACQVRRTLVFPFCHHPPSTHGLPSLICEWLPDAVATAFCSDTFVTRP